MTDLTFEEFLKEYQEFRKTNSNMSLFDYRELKKLNDPCDYCRELQFISSRHEPNCPLNPYFQNRIMQLPRENYFWELENVRR